jgi:hypothetical protein
MVLPVAHLFQSLVAIIVTEILAVAVVDEAVLRMGPSQVGIAKMAKGFPVIVRTGIWAKKIVQGGLPEVALCGLVVKESGTANGMTHAIGSGIIEIAREIASATVCAIVSETLYGIVIASVPLIVTAIATVIEIVTEIDVTGIVPTRVIIDGIVSVNGGDNLAMNFRLCARVDSKCPRFVATAVHVCRTYCTSCRAL